VEVAGLAAFELRGHVAGLRSFLHDEVLPQAQAEELVLFPVLDRLGGRLGAALSVEHDTVQKVAAALDHHADAPMTRPHVRRLTGLLDGNGLLIDRHLHHEADAALDALQRLADDERDCLVAAFALPEPREHLPWPPWLPELLPAVSDPSPADLLEPEEMVGASWPPGALLVVRSAIAAALDGTDDRAWRRALVEHSRYRLQLPHAKECMHAAGIWPWNGHR
jgi:hypothetical protein